MSIPDDILSTIHDALCDGGEEQTDVHVTHPDKAQRVVEALSAAGYLIVRDSAKPIAMDDTDRIKVTVTDLKSGYTETAEIQNDYVLITAGTCHQASLSSFANGTRQLTIKGRRGL